MRDGITAKLRAALTRATEPACTVRRVAQETGIGETSLYLFRAGKKTLGSANLDRLYVWLEQNEHLREE